MIRPINPTSLNSIGNVTMSGEYDILVAACTVATTSSLGHGRCQLFLSRGQTAGHGAKDQSAQVWVKLTQPQ